MEATVGSTAGMGDPTDLVVVPVGAEVVRALAVSYSLVATQCARRRRCFRRRHQGMAQHGDHQY
jgi:hypothetical protein